MSTWKLLQPGMNRNGPALEQVVYTVQQIVPERLAEEGLLLSSNPHSWIFTSVSVASNPRSYSSTSATVRIPVHTATKSGTETYPIGDDSLSKSTRRSFAPSPKPPGNHHFTCEQKPYPIWFSCPSKSSIRREIKQQENTGKHTSYLVSGWFSFPAQ